MSLLLGSLLLLAEAPAAAEPCVRADAPNAYWLIGAGAKQCAPPPPPPTRPVSAAERARIVRVADGVLLDGPSARWRFAFVRNSTACGYVNAKNRMGAYTGWTTFIFKFRTGAFEMYNGDGVDTDAIDFVCQGLKDP